MILTAQGSYWKPEHTSSSAEMSALVLAQRIQLHSRDTGRERTLTAEWTPAAHSANAWPEQPLQTPGFPLWAVSPRSVGQGQEIQLDQPCADAAGQLWDSWPSLCKCTHTTASIISLLGGLPTTFLCLVVVKSLDFLLHVKTIPYTLCPWNMNSRIFTKIYAAVFAKKYIYFFHRTCGK